MGRIRAGTALMCAGLLLATGCSKSESTRGSAAGTSSSSSVIAAPSSTSPQQATTTAGPATTATAPTTRPPAQPGTTVASGPLTASGQGWRLVVTAPTGGARIGPSTTLCYEVTGTSREPELVLEVTALPAGSPTGGTIVRVAAGVGRGSVRVPLAGISAGTYSVRVQLIVNGQALDGVNVIIPSVTLAPEVSPASCP